MDLEHVLNTAIDIAREAGATVRDRYGERRDIKRKSSAIDLVTEVDGQVEAQISKRLLAAFPSHRLIREEAGATDGPGSLAWHIDPLDGTTNYAHGFPAFAVSLALCDADEPLVGVIYDPLRDECFSACRGGGAWLAGAGGRRRLAVSGIAELGQSLLATGFPYDRHTTPHNNLLQFGAFLMRAQGLRRAGAAALDMAYVAAGRLDGFWEFRLSSWDVAAGILLVREAGGRVSDPLGGPLQIVTPLSLVASNGHIHDAMLAVLAGVAADG